MAKKKIVRKVKRVKRKPAVRRVVVKKPVRKNRLALAATALILNVLIFPLPGIGSLIGGKIKAGIWQLALGIVGSLLFVIWIGIPIWLVGWIWGIVTGVRLIQEAQ